MQISTVNVIVSYAIKSNIYNLLHGDCYGFVLNAMKTPGNWLLYDRSTKSGQRKKEHGLSPPDCLTASTPLHALPHPPTDCAYILSFIPPTDSLSVLCLSLVLTERRGSTQGDVADGRM
jgi:hypothetical protein